MNSFSDKIKHNNLMSKKYKKLWKAFKYFEQFIVFVSVISVCISIFTYALLVGVLAGIVSSVVGL